MKRILAVTLALILFLSGCTGNSGTGSDGGNGGGETYKIGVISPPVTQGWGSGVTYYAEKRCKELALGGDLEYPGRIEYRLFRCDSGEEVISGVEQLRGWGVQAVVVYPQWEGIEDTLQDLIDDGIPVVSVDLDIDCKGIYRVTGDNEGMGRQSAQYIVQMIGRTGTVVLLNSPAAGAVSTLRQKGFEEKLAEIAPDLTVYTYAVDFTRESGQALFADILSEQEHIDAVFSMDDETAIGVLNALKEKNRTDVQVVAGGGGCQEYLGLMMEEENADLHIQTTLYSPIIARNAVDYALAILRGERVKQTKSVSTTVVDKSNCETYLDENSPY